MFSKIIIGVIFIIFALVQYNDPDPWIWIFIYGLVGIIYLASINFSIPKWVIFVVMFSLIISVAYYLPKAMNWFNEGMPSIIGEMKATSPHIEWMREFLGLIICLLAIIWLYKLELTKKKRF